LQLSHFTHNVSELPLRENIALIFGSEDKGINDFWIKKANQIVQIPVKFPIDSLNLSVSAGVLIYHCMD